MTELWVFGYGSLIWRPGFPFLEQRKASLLGAHRSLCVYSWVHRGTPDRPGLVLGLDRGGMCRGIAFRIASSDWDNVVAYLREREQVTSVYLERRREIRFPEGGAAHALTYVVDRSHGQYAGKLDGDTQYRIVAEARGKSGANRDYVINTATHLEQLGMPDSNLGRLACRLQSAQTA